MEQQETEIWQSLVQKIDALPTTSPVPRLLYTYLQRSVLTREMSIDLSANGVRFNRKALDLSKRKKIRQVFEVFLKGKNQRITRSSLIEQIYANNQREASFRQQTCRNHNIVKLISRARKLATRTFFEERGAQCHWFPYDPSSQTWRLCALRDEELPKAL